MSLLTGLHPILNVHASFTFLVTIPLIVTLPNKCTKKTKQTQYHSENSQNISINTKLSTLQV